MYGNFSGVTPLALFGVSEAVWEWFQRDMGTWSDVIPEIVLSPDQAQLYKGSIQTFSFSNPRILWEKSLNPTKEKVGLWPPSKWVLPFDEEDGIEDDDGLGRAFRSDITKWQFEKNSNGEWIIPIWQDETFVEHILTPRSVLFTDFLVISGLLDSRDK